MIKPEDFEPIPENYFEAIRDTARKAPYSKLLGLDFDVVRKDYACMHLPYKKELEQPAGIIHGGAIASLIDTAVVGAIFSNVKEMPKQIVTVDMHVHYLSAAKEVNLIAHAAVRRRGRTMVCLEVDVVNEATDKIVAHGELGFMMLYDKP